jgi:hypothetical protein
MKLQKAYKISECQNCYYEALAYRIKKYEIYNGMAKKWFKNKYDLALSIMPKEMIEIYASTDLETLRQNLLRRQEHVARIEKSNESIVNLYGCVTENIILGNLLNDTDEYCKLMYLTNYLISHITYSKDWFKYCASNLPGDGFDFDFKNGVPVEKTINGTLAIGQGGCDEISNLACYLGAKLGLNIYKVFTSYRGHLHTMNIVIFKDGTKSYIDYTNVIRNTKMIDNYFLVSATDINIFNEYSADNANGRTFGTHDNIDLSNTKTISRDNIDYSYKVISHCAYQMDQALDDLKVEYSPKNNGNSKILKG